MNRLALGERIDSKQPLIASARIETLAMKQNWIGYGVLLLAICGCGPSGLIVGQVDPTRAKLQQISGAYLAATVKANRPPTKPEELLPFLGDKSTPDEEKREIFRSNKDSEEFVIVWGVDLRKAGTDELPRDVIFAYEKKGKDGKRYVLKTPTDVFVIPDDLFQKSSFPKGHQPSS